MTAEWSVADAKARLSEVIDQAIANGPQTITRRGRATVIVVSTAEWERRNRQRGSLVEFFARSPLREFGITIESFRDKPRDIDL
jgi:prevent-host-death family protein